MGAIANETWGADPASAPPSLSSHSLDAFGCPPAHRARAVTALTYVGDTRARGETVRTAARLTSDGEPIAHQPVTFTVARRSPDATTDADGVARTTFVIPDHGRSVEVKIDYAGTERYLPSTTSATVRWGS